uniref:C-X-C chemokine receptor type 2 n=1 Tax=Geotrypetes seraphini TaxID=260995 RepID=A0A6P8QX27_GEOSA|nr:C-X-C chemokine receptor type 2 [Geotrypetes seraphini]
MSFNIDGSDLKDSFTDYDYNINATLPNYEVAAPCVTQSIDKNFLATVYVLVFFLSLVGNSLVVLVICYNKFKRSSTDVYLLNLAIADILFAITLPFWATYKVYGWIFGAFMCKAISALQEINFYSGILLLACISVDRYFAIVRAMETVTQKRHLVKFVCLGIWISSIVLSVPIFLYKNDFNTRENIKVCHEDRGSHGTDRLRIILRFIRHTIGFFLPLLIMLFCYGSTIKTLCQTKSNQKHRAMKVIFAVVLAFLCCWLPYNITVVVDSLMRSNIVNQTCEVRSQVDTALAVTEIFGFIHSCINPILYAFIGQKFRNSFLKILVTKGVISKTFLSQYGRGSVTSTSGNTSTTL